MNLRENSNSFDVLIGSKRRNTDFSQDETIVIPPSYSGYQIPPPSQQNIGTNGSSSSNIHLEQNHHLVKKPPPRVISRTIRRGSKKSNSRKKKRSVSGFTFEDEALISNLIDGVKADPPDFQKVLSKRRRRIKGQTLQTPRNNPLRMKSTPHNSGPFPLTIHSQGSGSGMSLTSSSTSSSARKHHVMNNIKNPQKPIISDNNPLKRKRIQHEEIMGELQQQPQQPPTKKLRIMSPKSSDGDNIINPPPPPPPRMYPFSSRNRIKLNSENNNPLSSKKEVKSTQYITVNSRVYWKLGVVGRGGSSKVFKCICEDSNEIVAIKRVRLIGPSHIIRSFLNEVEILKNLQGSKHIIRLYDSEVKDGELYLVMECGEVDLNNVLRRQRNQPLNLNLVRLYWEQMLESVSAIHERRIVHGDLKPANFLLVRGAIKLIDFGIAKAIQHDNTTNIVREAQVGTLNYISPEALQIHHEEYDEDDDDDNVNNKGRSTSSASSSSEGRPRYKVGRSSDIWSLGCILSQMVTGHAPFAHYPMFQKIQAIVDDDVKIVVPKHVPLDVASIVKMTLRRDPQKRPTIPELLNHPFLKPNKKTSTNNNNNSTSYNSGSSVGMMSRRDAALLLNRNSQVLFSSKYGRKEKEFFCSEMIKRVQDENLSCAEIMNIPIQKIKRRKKKSFQNSNNSPEKFSEIPPPPPPPPHVVSNNDDKKRNDGSSKFGYHNR